MSDQRKTILITGGESMIASYLKKRSRGHCVFLSRDQLDIRDENQFLALVRKYRPVTVMNTAGNATGSPEDMNGVYARYPLRLASICCDNGIRFMFLSSGRVFDGTGISPYTFNDPVNPVDAYGKAVRTAEMNLLNLPDTSHVAVVRLAMVLGVRSHNPERQGIYRLLQAAAQKGAIRVAGDVIHSPVYAGDVADHLLSMAHSRAPVPRVNHISGSDTVSYYDLVTSLAEKLGIKATITPGRARDFGSPGPLFQALEPSIRPAFAWKQAAERFVCDWITSYGSMETLYQ